MRSTWTNLNKKSAWLLRLLAVSVCASSFPAMAASTLFSDLGLPGNQYSCCTGWAVSGAASDIGFITDANLFTVGGNGNFDVTQIDVGIGWQDPPPTFYASIWTDNAGLPGSQVAGAFWSPLTTITEAGVCPPTCPGSYDGGGFVTISGISGVSLTGGQSYFMILGPLNLSDTSFNSWNWNSTGAPGWNCIPTTADLGSGVASLAAAARRRLHFR
jgi:hypothetical protein